jgi:peroxiredoxin
VRRSSLLPLGLAVAALLVGRAVAEEEAPGTARIDSVRSFTLEDLDGRKRSLVDWRGVPVLVLAWTAPGCPVAKVYAPRLAAFAKAWAGKGVAFLGVSSNAKESIEALRALAKDAGFEFPVLIDADGSLAQRVGAKTTTTVVVLDANRRVRYRGAFDDQYGVSGRKPAAGKEWVREAIEAVLEARAVGTPSTEAPGCPITFARPAAARAKVTWSGQAAAIVHRRCATCHREGEGGPFELLRYADVESRTAVMKEVVTEGRMPPWTADAPPGTFSNDRRLTAEEKTTLLAWIDEGAPEGDPRKAPEPPPLARVDGWEIGKPDAILGFAKPEAVPAEGVVSYRFVEVKTDFPEDRWVEASEVRPGDPDVVHHVLVAVAPEGQKRVRGLFDPLQGFFAAMVPGGRAQVYPPGMAKRLPKGSRLVFQMHYTPNGVETTDLTRIGLRFAKGEPEHEVLTAGAYNPRLRIPPGAADYVATAALPVPFDVKVLAYMPHAHVRATSFRYELVRLGSEPTTILSVPKYDFNWQTPLRLAEPLLVKQGAFLKVTATYDNSEANPYNPDPTVEVRWGDQTWDEMLIGYVDYVRLP